METYSYLIVTISKMVSKHMFHVLKVLGYDIYYEIRKIGPALERWTPNDFTLVHVIDNDNEKKAWQDYEISCQFIHYFSIQIKNMGDLSISEIEETMKSKHVKESLKRKINVHKMPQPKSQRRI